MIGPLLLAALLTADTAPPRVLDRVAGTVNGDVITLSEVQERAAVELRRAEAQPGGASRDRARKALKVAFDNLVAERLFAAQVSSMGIEVSDAEIDTVVEDTKRRYGLTDESLDQALRQQGMDRASYRKAVRRDIESVRLMQVKVRSRVKVTDEDVQNYYQTHPGEFRAPEEIKARHIFIAAPPPAEDGPEVKRARETAEKALQRVRAGEDFGAVAKQMSQGPSASDGGELGWLRRGSVQEDIEKAAFALQPGGVSDLIRTRTGFQIIQVQQRRGGGTRPLSEVKDEIKDHLVNDQADNYRTQFIAELRKDAVIEAKAPELKE